MSSSTIIEKRSELLDLLAEAAELEHGIACSYLYAGFSLKREIAEGGMTWLEQQTVRRWAAQIYFIASQEMLHLALVWNLTTAIGGTPYYFRPNFPQDSKYYPINVPIALEPFGVHTLRRFLRYEHPETFTAKPDLKLLAFEGVETEDIEFGSVGELYRMIESGFRAIDEKELFIGSRTQQMTPDLVHFPGLVAVVDRASAIRAVGEIVKQGEGTARDRDDSHYGAFVTILKELLDMGSRGAGFSPARPAMHNPAARLERGYAANANPIDDPLAERVASLFDAVYGLMLRMLAWSFEFDARDAEAQLKEFCSVAIDLMPRVLLSLGEGLMLMPAGKSHPGKTAGPGFGLTRHVMLSPDREVTRRLCQEQIRELAAFAADVLKHPLPDPVKSGCSHLQGIAANFI
jgi:hypothetical protein